MDENSHIRIDDDVSIRSDAATANFVLEVKVAKPEVHDTSLNKEEFKELEHHKKNPDEKKYIRESGY